MRLTFERLRQLVSEGNKAELRKFLDAVNQEEDDVLHTLLDGAGVSIHPTSRIRNQAALQAWVCRQIRSNLI